jgi:hypothetical protein
MQERQHPDPLEALFPTGPSGALPSGAGLAATRDRLAELDAAADRILARLGSADSQSFLEQVRQSGGQ